MELEQARKRAEELRVIIEKNNRLYYDQDAPELEDFEYDALNRELKQIEAEYPELVTTSSPAQHVAGTASSNGGSANVSRIQPPTSAPCSSGQMRGGGSVVPSSRAIHNPAKD